MLNMRSEKGKNVYAALEFGTRIKTTNEIKKLNFSKKKKKV